MKKLFMLIGVTLGLTGLNKAQADNTWVTPQPLAKYLYTTNVMATGEFFDLSTAYTVDNGAIKPNGTATAYGIDKILPFGESLATGTSLNNLFFGYDNGGWTSVTAGSKATALRLTDIGLTDFSFMEKKVTGLILSAAGGVYFTDDASGEAVELTLPDPLADLNGQSVQYAARGFIAHTSVVDGSILGNVPITKMADKPVGCMALCTDKISGLKYLLVQYNLSVKSHTLVYQIRIGDDGRVEYRIGKQDKTTGDDVYTFRIDLKRNTEAVSFGGTSTYIIDLIDRDNEKSWWTINSSQALENRSLSIHPKGGTINGMPNYTSISTSVVLSEKSKAALTNATSLLVFVTPRSSVTPKFENKAYAVGDEVENGNDFRAPYRVVYNEKPANLNDISFVAHDLNPNEKYYLYAYLCKKDGDNYRYSTDVFVFSDDILTRPMETPANVTVGELNGNALPLTFTATTYKTLVMKSDSVQSNVPRGVLQAGDRDGHVIAILEPNATSCNIEMEAGEMTYLQMYAMTADEIPEYSSNFTLVPLYRQAEQLPLRYEFGLKDLIPQTYDEQGVLATLPVLPPGLSTSSTQPDNAFLVDDYIGEQERIPVLLSYKTQKEPAWPNVILPTFSGAKNVQVSFKVTFYNTNGMGQINASAPDKTDSVRIEYRLNGGEWQTAGLFTKGNMPESVGYTYTLSASIKCEATDVVNIRYSYFTATTQTKHTIASYEIEEQRDCETPTALQMVSDGTTNTAIALKWKDDENIPAAGNYVVSYQKADADAWQTQTANKTEAVLSGLDANTAYNVKVQAICKSGPSIETSPVRMSTAAAIPYIEDMAFIWDDEANDYSTSPDVTVYNGELGGELEADDYMSSSTTWSIEYNKAYSFDEDVLDPDGLGVATDMAHALLTTPAIYVRKAGAFLPKTLAFRVNTYDRAVVNDQPVFHDGVDLVDPALRLYVLATTNGTFTWNDTIAAFDHNALKANAAKDGERGIALSVPMNQFEGLVQIAFYFHNPNPFTYDNADENAFPMYLELLGISFRYDDGDDPCFPVKALKATKINETDATLTWQGEGVEYGITYYPANDATKAKTVYQDATEAALQTVKLEGLTSYTTYKADVVSYCTKGDREHGSTAISVEFKTLRDLFEIAVSITPEIAGTVKGAGSYFEGETVHLAASANEGYKFVAWRNGETELSKDTIFTFKMPSENLAYTAVFEKDSVEPEGIEDLVKANFNVSTDHGRLIVRNLNGTLVKDIDVYGLTGNRIDRFTPNSREDLMLPLHAGRAVLIIRLNTEKGVAVYKSYVH